MSFLYCGGAYWGNCPVHARLPNVRRSAQFRSQPQSSAETGDLLQLVIAVLLSSVTGYTLAAWHRDWALSVEAGMKYFLMGALANALLVTGGALVLGLLGDSG